MNIKKYKTEYDVVVVGGGTAGAFAAITAAQTGAKTLIIEKETRGRFSCLLSSYLFRKSVIYHRFIYKTIYKTGDKNKK